jgi:hypothetical protein
MAHAPHEADPAGTTDRAAGEDRGASEPASTSTPARAEDVLSERDLALLDLERQWWKQPGSKEQAVRDRFGIGTTRYYQLVNALIEREAALRHDPMLVKRLRRARADRVRTRAARRMVTSPR